MTKKQETKQVTLEKAFILEEQTGMDLVNALQNLPIRFSQVIIPILQKLEKTYRADVTVNIPDDEDAK